MPLAISSSAEARAIASNCSSSSCSGLMEALVRPLVNVTSRSDPAGGFETIQSIVGLSLRRLQSARLFRLVHPRNPASNYARPLETAGFVRLNLCGASQLAEIT